MTNDNLLANPSGFWLLLLLLLPAAKNLAFIKRCIVIFTRLGERRTVYCILRRPIYCNILHNIAIYCSLKQANIAIYAVSVCLADWLSEANIAILQYFYINILYSEATIYCSIYCSCSYYLLFTLWSHNSL